MNLNNQLNSYDLYDYLTADITAGGSPVVFNTDTGCDTATTNTFTLVAPDPLIDWLPYHYKKYLPTWHLVRSYK